MLRLTENTFMGEAHKYRIYTFHILILFRIRSKVNKEKIATFSLLIAGLLMALCKSRNVSKMI